MRCLSTSCPTGERSHCVLFAAVWAAAALLLGLIARAAGAERLTAAFLLLLGVGLWGYLAAGVALLTVRQIPAHDAFSAAGALQTVYVPAALAGVAGALVGLPRERPRARAPRCCCPSQSLLRASSACWTRCCRERRARPPPAARSRARSPDRERSRRAARPRAGARRARAGAAQASSAAARRPAAARPRRAPRPARLRRRRGLRGARRRRADRPASGLHRARRPGGQAAARGPSGPSLRGALCATARLRSGSTGSRPTSLSRSASRWTRRAARSPGSRWAARRTSVTASASGSRSRSSSWAWQASAGSSPRGSAPWRYRQKQEAQEREAARGLVARWGADTLAPFVLRADKSYFFSEDERAFLAYRVVGGVAVVSGDPIGPPAEFDRLVARVHRVRPGARLADRDSRRLRELPRRLPRPRSSRPLPRRRGGRSRRRRSRSTGERSARSASPFTG